MLHFYGEGLLASHPDPKMEDNHLSAVRECSISGGLLLHPEPEDAPYSGDKGHVAAQNSTEYENFSEHKTNSRIYSLTIHAINNM
jgi:hypothetical protein